MTDDDLIDYATQFRFAIIGNGPSAWMCAAISAPLAAALAVRGQCASLVETDLGVCNHVFIRLEDGRVLDPTADQFNWISRTTLPPVYLGDQASIHTNAFPYNGQCWLDLMRAFSRLHPGLRAAEVGEMVRMTLATLPPECGALPLVNTAIEAA